MPKTGGAVERVSTAAGFVGRIAVDDRNVYWTDGDGKSPWVLKKRPKAGGEVVVLVGGHVLLESDLLSDDRFVYWNIDHAVEPSMEFGAIRRISVDGGAFEEFASNQRFAFAMQRGDDEFLYWLAAPSTGDGWARARLIRRMGRDGGAVQDVVTASKNIAGFAVTHGSLLWLDEDDPRDVWSCEVASCVPRVVQQGASGFGGAATDGAAWYLSTSPGLWRLSLDGATRSVLPALDGPFAIDNDRIFSVGRWTGVVRSSPKR